MYMLIDYIYYVVFVEDGMKQMYTDMEQLPIMLNADQVVHPILSERYRREYAEFLRFLYERGVKISYGTDEHSVYNDRREAVLQALAKVGFGENDLI